MNGTGHNVFFRDGDKVFRTYFINVRGDEAMGTIWSYLDITPLGTQLAVPPIFKPRADRNPSARLSVNI